ncbi:MAG TPA: thioredoxin family protein, partial [Planctomycetaceae bacterium]|nr:thioredoxin family protein [Planctomycetaceae bacterium]
MTTIPALFLALISCGATPQGEVLDFGASWCGPCQRMHPIVERLQRQGLPIRKVDIDQEPGLAQKYRIQSVPQFVLVVNGREVRRITGVTDENTLRQLLSQIPKAPPATPPTVVQNDEGFQPVAVPAVAENQPAPPRNFAPLTPPANRKRSRLLPGPMVNTKPNRPAREKEP